MPSPPTPRQARCAATIGYACAVLSASVATYLIVRALCGTSMGGGMFEIALTWVAIVLLLRLSWECVRAALDCQNLGTFEPESHTRGLRCTPRPLEPRRPGTPQHLEPRRRRPSTFNGLLIAVGMMLVSPNTASANEPTGVSVTLGEEAHDATDPLPTFVPLDPHKGTAGCRPNPEPEWSPVAASAGIHCADADDELERTAPSARISKEGHPIHVVQPGDTLWNLAESSLPSEASPRDVAHAVHAWIAANPHVADRPDHLVVGMRLHRPSSEAPTHHTHRPEGSTP